MRRLRNPLQFALFPLGGPEQRAQYFLFAHQLGQAFPNQARLWD
jgi:hypothetical protein